MAENYVWIPVEDGEYACTCPECFGELEDHTAVNYYVNDRGRTLGIVEREDEDCYFEVELAPDVRLCRSVPLPQPDWSTAPEWAQWWAVEPTGNTFWFREKPIIKYGQWNTLDTWTSPGTTDLPIGIDWRLTLQSRPEGE